MMTILVCYDGVQRGAQEKNHAVCRERISFTVKYLYIVRHGETEWNTQGRMQGRMDSSLTDSGREQASVNGALLKRLGGVDYLAVSPSGRTIETAFLINSHVRAPIHYSDQLMERDCGAWSGLLLEEIEEHYPQEWRAREEDPYRFRPPEGESLEDMLERVHDFLDGLFAQDWESIGLITHGVMSKVILKFFLGLNEIECSRLRHPNELVYRLTFNAQDIDTHHYLAGGEPQSGMLRRDAEPQPHKPS